MRDYLIFFSHDPQLNWYGLFAEELRRRPGLGTVAWVLGSADYEAATETGAFDEVVDLLFGFDLEKIDAYDDRACRDLRELELLEGGHPFFHRYAAMDRHLRSRGWPGTHIVAYAASIVRAMRADLHRRGAQPLAVFGEANTLPYALAHHIFDNTVPYWNFAMLRHWDQRFFLDEGQRGAWPECVNAYRSFMKNGIPEDLRALCEPLLRALSEGSARPLDAQRWPSLFNRAKQALRAGTISAAWKAWRPFSNVAERRSNPAAKGPWQMSPLLRPLRFIREAVSRQIFLMRSQRCVPESPFASYFLHTQPEHSVEGMAFHYRDQAALVENLAASIPADWRLLVREHLPMMSARSGGWHHRLLKVPNLVLQAPVTPSIEAIRRSRVVITLTGTAGLEAMYLGVPVVVLGDVFFEHFEGIHKARSSAEVGELIRRIEVGELKGASTESALAGLAAMHAASHPGAVGAAYTMAEMATESNVRAVCSAVRQALRARGPVPT